MIRQFMVVTTFKEKRKFSIPFDAIKSIEEESVGEISYTKIFYNNSDWVKVSETVDEVVEKVNSFYRGAF